jgi:hypothetical protein
MDELHERMRCVDWVDSVDPDIEEQKFGDEALLLRREGRQLLQGEDGIGQPDDEDR